MGFYGTPQLSTCPVCGAMHDDGVQIEHRGTARFVCLDCADRLPARGEERERALDRALAAERR